jgi:hypothetical protein
MQDLHLLVTWPHDRAEKPLLPLSILQAHVQVAHFIRLSLGRVYTDLDTVNI